MDTFGAGREQPGPGRDFPPPVHAAAHVDDEIATALHILFPLRSWLHNSGWRQGLRLLVIGQPAVPR